MLDDSCGLHANSSYSCKSVMRFYVMFVALRFCLRVFSIYIYEISDNFLLSTLPLPNCFYTVKIMTVQDKCNVISLNVRGLRNRVKRRSIFCFLKDQNCDVYFLQETYSEPNDENI